MLLVEELIGTRKCWRQMLLAQDFRIVENLISSMSKKRHYVKLRRLLNQERKENFRMI